jgi:hypothetical protein
MTKRTSRSTPMTGGGARRAARERARAVPGPEPWRYLEALTGLLESDEDFTTRALAERLQMTPAGLLRFQCEHPDVTQWASERLEERNRAMVGPLLAKCAELAQAGSAAHAAVLVQFAGDAVAAGSGARASRVTLQGPLVVTVSTKAGA